MLFLAVGEVEVNVFGGSVPFFQNSGGGIACPI
jgi:hypothetical protein